VTSKAPGQPAPPCSPVPLSASSTRTADRPARMPIGTLTKKIECYPAAWVRTPPGTRPMQAPAAPATLSALPVTPLEQVPGSCLEALGAEHLEAEGVGEPVGRAERGADRQRVLDLLA